MNTHNQFIFFALFLLTLPLFAADLPHFDGTFVTDDATLRSMSWDFGHHEHKMPAGVLFPKSTTDVQKIIRYATSQKLKVVTRGTSGAAYGQAQVDKGIIINSSSLNKMDWVNKNQIDVQPGALWSDVVDFTLKKNMAPPVLPDTLFISVGGTLSVGGIGETSYRLGAQVDHVAELEVVTGTGQVLICSPKRNPELFHMILAGMGQVGVITRARLNLLPAPVGTPVSVRQFKYKGGDYALYLADLTNIALKENQGAIGGHIVRNPDNTWTFVMEISNWGGPEEPLWVKEVKGSFDGVVNKVSFHDYFHRNTKGYLAAVASGAILSPHAYASFFLTDKATPEMLDHLVNTPDAALGAGRIALFPMINNNFHKPLQMMTESDHSFHIRIYRVAKAENTPEHLQMIKLNNEDILPRVFASKGKVYLPFSPLLNAEQKLSQFGKENWKRWAAAKKKYDPQSVLSPSAGLFPCQDVLKLLESK